MKILLTLITLVFSLNSQAALHFEPLAYFAMGTSTEQNTNQEFKQQGYLFGTRLGLYKNHFMIGLEYLTGSVDIKEENSNAEFEETPHYMGAYLGYHIKKRVGINISYFPKVRSNIDNGSKLSGDAWKAELYYRIKTNISMRLGYSHRTLDFDEVTNQDILNTFESKTILLGLSFPWVL